MRIAINGFGRIGRNFLRTVLQNKEVAEKLNVVAINVGPAKIEFTAYMFKYDTLLGIWPGAVSLEGNKLIVDGHEIELIAECNASTLPWASYKIDWVVDASGAFTRREKAQLHIDAGAKAVLITAPAHNDDITIIPGVNMQQFMPQKHTIVSLGSCTTNAFVPMVKVLHDAFGIASGFMTTIHAYTNSQVLLDVEAKSLRLSRAAALNIIPSTTGAAKTLGKVIPELGSRIKAGALRVPVGKVSLIDLVVTTEKAVTSELLNKEFEKVSKSALKGVIDIAYEPLVSSDFSGNPYSVVIDGTLTDVQGNMAQVFGWYDNEWGYSERLKDFLLYTLEI